MSKYMLIDLIVKGHVVEKIVVLIQDISCFGSSLFF